MRRKQQLNKYVNQMNVVPYIDIMLVLLVIFMVTAPLFVPGVINLPTVGRANKIVELPIEININSNKEYSITQNNKTTNIKSLSQLINLISTMTDSNSSVVISADKEVKYNIVIQVVDKLYAKGIKKVALVVKEKNGQIK